MCTDIYQNTRLHTYIRTNMELILLTITNLMTFQLFFLNLHVLLNHFRYKLFLKKSNGIYGSVIVHMAC